MYKDHWGLEELPFENVPDPRFFYPSSDHQEALLRMFYAVNSSKGAAMLTGEVGCGKTILSRTLIQDLPPERYEIGVIANPSLSPVEFLKEILYQLGIESAADSKLDLLHALNDQMVKSLNEGKNTVVIIDEAQAIEDPETLEELRLLLNFQLNDRFLLTLLLIGQPELRDKIGAIKQLDQRIAIKYHLGPLKLDDTKAYIQTRMDKAGVTKRIFREDAVEAIHKASGGVPRDINNICDLCLLLGLGSKLEEIDTDVVPKAVGAVMQP